MPSEDFKILEFKQSHPSDQTAFVVYTDSKCLTDRTDACKNTPEYRWAYSIRFLNAYSIVI